jgi:hypothetical protein
MAQAKGSSGQLLLYKETSYKTAPSPVAAKSMPFKSTELSGSRTLNDSEMMSGDRNAKAPDYGNNDVAGSIVVPIDLRAIGWWLTGLVGVPATTQQAAKSINNGEAAVDRSGGVVGIPVTSHGFQTGESVTIAATTNYNGTYTVLAASTTHEVRITATYNAETFGADDTIRAARYTHVFKVDNTDSLYSYGIEQGFTDIAQYQLFTGCKFGKFSFETGGDKSELFMTIDVMGAQEAALAGTSCDSSPDSISLTKFGNFEAAVTEGGSPAANVKSLSLTFDNKLDGDTFVLGDGGVRGAINEGIASPSGEMTAMFENATLYNKAVNGTESSLSLVFTKGVYSLTFAVDELIYERKGPSITTPTGIWLSAPFRGYYSDDADATCIKVTLVNDVSAYTW